MNIIETSSFSFSSSSSSSLSVSHQDWLYLSSFGSARSPELLREYGIAAVVSIVGRPEEEVALHPGMVTYKHLEVEHGNMTVSWEGLLFMCGICGLFGSFKIKGGNPLGTTLQQCIPLSRAIAHKASMSLFIGECERMQ